MPPDGAARAPRGVSSGPEWVTVASYNIHSSVGGDRRRDPERIAAVIREIDPQVIGLQEVTLDRFRGSEVDELEELARATGLHAIFAPTMENDAYRYGNALMTSGRVVKWRRHDLSQPGREPRLAIESEIQIGKRTLGCVVFHMGLKASERRAQTERLLSIPPADAPHPYVLMGDFNEWRVRARSLRECDTKLAGCQPAPRSFPARFPMFALDRVWAFPPTTRLEVAAHRSELARIASDHLPIVARVDLATG